MEERSKGAPSFQETVPQIHMDTIIRDILKEWLAVLLLTASVAMISYMAETCRYHPLYTTRATLFVTTRGINNTIYHNQNSAAEAAVKFSQILNSSLLQKKVAEEIGLPKFQGETSAKVVENTNLLEVEVTSNTPQLSFQQMKSILGSYNKISEYLLGDAILEVLQDPTVPTAPNTPFNPIPVVEKASFGATIGICLLLGILSLMKDTIRTEKDIERKLESRRLVTIPHENKYKTLKARLRRRKKSILITDSTISFRYVEAIKKLSHRVKNEMDHREGKVLMVTSVLENEGKSTVAANLALALSEECPKTMLIDCDFTNPSLYKVLRMQNEKFDHFAEVLNGKGEARNLVRKVSDRELYTVLNAVPVSAADLLNTGRFQQMIRFFREEMDYIILDTAPMALVADAEEIVNLVDVSLLVVKQHLVEARDLNDAIDILNGSHWKLAGCVFNDNHLSMLENGRAYGYGGGYGQ